MFDGRMDGPSGRGRADGAARGGPDARRDAPDPLLARVLREARAERFPPGFADRVMRSVAAAGAGEPGVQRGAGTPTLASALTHQFLRLAPLAAALIAGLFVYNVWVAGSGRPTLDDAFGLPPVTLGEAYSMEVLLRASPSVETPE